MTDLQAIILAIVQGITELFPISGLGHAVLLPALLGWKVDEGAASFLPFLVVMHLGTAVALLAYFWQDWFNFATAVLVRRGPKAEEGERRIFWRVVSGHRTGGDHRLPVREAAGPGATAPADADGQLPDHRSRVMLFAAERLKGRQGARAVAAALDRRGDHRLLSGAWR